MTDQQPPGLTGGEALRGDPEPFVMLPVALLEDDRLSERAVLLYAVLRRWKDGPLGIVPSRDLLRRRLRCSVDSVDRAARELAAAGYLTVHRRFRLPDGRIVREDDVASPVGLPHTSSEYHLHPMPSRVPSPEVSPVPSPESDAGAESDALADEGGGRTAAARGGRTAAARGGRTGAARIEIDPEACLLANAGAREPEPEATPDPSKPPEQADPGRAVLEHLRALVMARGVVVPPGPWGTWWVRRGLTGADVDLAFAEVEGASPDRWWRFLVSVLERASRDREAGSDPWPSSEPRAVAQPAPRAPWSPPRPFDPQAAQRAMRPTGGVA